MLSNINDLLSSMEAPVTTYSTVKVSKRYQIAVPALARQLLKIDRGDRLLVDVQDGILLLIPEPENYTEALAGLHKQIWEGVGGQEYYR